MSISKKYSTLTLDDKIITMKWSNSFKKNIITEELLCFLPVEMWYYVLSFINDDFLLCGTLNNKVYIIYNPYYILRSNIFEIDFEPFDDLTLSNDSKLLLSYKNKENISSARNTPICDIHIFDIQNKRMLMNIKINEYTYSINVAPNNRYFIIRAQDGLLILYKIDGSYIKTINTSSYVFNIIFLSNKDILIEQVDSIFELNVLTGEIKNRQVYNHLKSRISPTNNIMLTCEKNSDILIRDIHKNSIIGVFETKIYGGFAYEKLVFSPHDKYISRFVNNYCFVYDASTGKIKYHIKMSDSLSMYSKLRTVAFSFDNKFIATSLMNEITLWQL